MCRRAAKRSHLHGDRPRCALRGGEGVAEISELAAGNGGVLERTIGLLWLDIGYGHERERGSREEGTRHHLEAARRRYGSDASRMPFWMPFYGERVNHGECVQHGNSGNGAFRRATGNIIQARYTLRDFVSAAVTDGTLLEDMGKPRLSMDRGERETPTGGTPA